MQRPIGGFFGLELESGDNCYHKNAIALSTGRACLRLILHLLKPSLVYVPYYSCDALCEPMQTMNIPIKYYEIDENLEIESIPNLNPREYLIACDYFGVKGNYVDKLIGKYGESIIVDNTHRFFHEGYENNCSFTSARKYFGVPDGAFAYIAKHKWTKVIPRNSSVSILHNALRLLGRQQESYEAYLDYEKSLGDNLERVSLLSERLLSQVDYEKVQEVRKSNFLYLANALAEQNELDVNSSESPFCYPFLPTRPIKKEKLYSEQLFIPSLWLDTLNRSNLQNSFLTSKKLSQELLPLPIDHRYGREDMNRIIDVIKSTV